MAPPPLRRFIRWLFIVSALGVLALCGLSFYLTSDPDIPHGGDPLEDRRGLLRRVSEPVLRDISARIHFRGTLVVETLEQGQHDLWLVSASRFGTTTRRLTDSPADETYPVWSPDGRWIAYLSNAPGKSEVFALRVEDGQTVQLTRAPEIEWRGPLDWRIDLTSLYETEGGRTWLVLTGAPVSDPAASSIYQIPTSGEDRAPLLVDNTNGAVGLVRSDFGPLYATSGGVLAYRIEYPYENLDLRRLDAPGGRFVTPSEHARGLDIVPGSFGWTGDYYGELIFLALGEPPDGEVGFEVGLASVRRARPAAGENFDYAFEGFQTRSMLTGRPGTLRAIIPTWNRRFLALQDGLLDGRGQTGCLRLHIYSLYDQPVNPGRPALFPDLCLDDLPAGFHPQSRMREENIKHQFAAYWYLFSGRGPGDEHSSLYAVLFYNDTKYLHLTQLRPLPARLSGEIVPGSARLQPFHRVPQPYLDMISSSVDPRPAP